jgi:hypothetical protein
MAYRCQNNFFRKSKLNLKTPLAYRYDRCHWHYRCHWPIAAIDQYALRSEEDILLQQSGSTINSHVFKWKNSRDEMKQKRARKMIERGKN